MKGMKRIPCVIYRGGTSKAVFVKENDLPGDPQLRDNVIRVIMGGGDKREIDGLGGADLLTSKFAIVGPPSRSDADVDYTFVQVGIEEPWVSYDINCGNISSAVGPYAIEEGFVRGIEPITKVRIHNTNTKKILISEIPVRDGKSVISGDYHIDGVPGTGAKIMLDYSNSWGTLGGKLLPTGNPRDKVYVEELGEVTISIVDIANPTVFIRAEEIGLKGTELPQDFDPNKDVRKKIETIRIAAWELINRKPTKLIPFFLFVAKAADYTKYTTGEKISKEHMSFTARLATVSGMHKAYPGTGSVSTSVAAMIEGTVVNEVCSEVAKKSHIIKIGHPSGIMVNEADVEKVNNIWKVKRAAYGRTARRIMEGYVYVRHSFYESS